MTVQEQRQTECDRCGRTVIDVKEPGGGQPQKAMNARNFTRLHAPDMLGASREFDLCSYCTGDFMDFVSNRKTVVRYRDGMTEPQAVTA